MASSPVTNMHQFRQKEVEESQRFEFNEEADKSLGVNAAVLEQNCPMLVPMQKEFLGGGSSSKECGDLFNEEVEKVSSERVHVVNTNNPNVEVDIENRNPLGGHVCGRPSLDFGPTVEGVFGVSSENNNPKKKKKPSNSKGKKVVGQRHKGSPEEVSRPKKRPRSVMEDRFDLNRDFDPNLNWVSASEG
ncbi:hypothetical protein Hanom_Chr03g00218591 [Helianthus anomalus]